ncbi:hypothetical protein AWC38_SpisGene11079 [Stylophora pistillata]|uniref:Uncharacterized protein n=1 Tax=Stylophora pistillata TaxID=50429 RepID=A0A2B4S6W4_STYPI|nr:hypothetical protein AWC38_SpisGene11079 [Stylophora pistillata]
MMTLQVLCKANKENECLWKGPLGDLEGLRSEVNKHVTEQLSSHIGLCFKYMKERKEGGDNSSQQQADQEGMLVQQQQKEIVMSNEVHHLKHQLWKTKEAPMRHGMALQMIK